MTAAIALWNTVYLERAAHALSGNGHAVDDVLSQYLSPAGLETHQSERRSLLAQ
jgi:hypothetical protein